MHQHHVVVERASVYKLFDIFLKDYIIKLIDNRIEDKVIEMYWEHKRADTKDRINKMRKASEDNNNRIIKEDVQQ